MFWFGKKKKAGKAPAKSAAQKRSKDSEKIRAEAMKNVRAARAHIGEDTLDRIAAAMARKQSSATERAKRQIEEADPDKVLDELLWMLEDRDKR